MHLLIGEIQKDQKKNCAIFWLNKPRSPSFVKSFRTKVKEIILTPSPILSEFDNERLLRLFESIITYNISLDYIKAKVNNVTNALSRLPVE